MLGGFGKLSTALGLGNYSVHNTFLDRTSVQKSVIAPLMMSAAEISRQLRDTENYPKCFEQSQARIEFEYIVTKSIRVLHFI